MAQNLMSQAKSTVFQTTQSETINSKKPSSWMLSSKMFGTSAQQLCLTCMITAKGEKNLNLFIICVTNLQVDAVV